MHNKLLDRFFFFQTIKFCCQVTSFFKKISIGMFKKQAVLSYKRKNVARLGGYMIKKEICVYMIKKDGALIEMIPPFEAKWDEQKSI